MASTVIILHQGKEWSADLTIQNAVRVQHNIARAVREQGYQPESVFLDDRFKWVSGIQSLRDTGDLSLVVNVADLGFHYNNAYEPNIPAVLDGLDVRYTGSTHYAMAFSSDKYASCVYLRAVGVPTPECALASQPAEKFPDLPVIIKQRFVHNSLGLDEQSVTYTRTQLDDALARLHQQRQSLDSWVIQEYIEDDEVTELCAGFIGNRERKMLPVVAFSFGAAFEGQPKIRDFSAKWREETPQYQEALAHFVDLPRSLEEQVHRYTHTIADAFGIRDYGRFDFRIKRSVDGTATPLIIDINANPDLNTDATLYKMASCAGLNYTQFIDKIMHAALERER